MARTKKKIVPPITDKEEIQYVIYCRKSTDESSNKQVASIPRQIIECLKYAKNEGLTIKKKPKDFLKFETEKEIHKENTCSELDNRKLYLDTRDIFIVKEQESGKIPFNRKKWSRLMRMVEKGEIRGLLSYSPDRQSRNMLEGGQLIDFVDQEILELKYTNFHFEPTASGKMMLGIWFVFSKQYSDKLSEDVTDGNEKATGRAETVGAIKHGYIRGEDKKWKPDGRNFDIVKEAFDLKLDQNLADEKIADYMNKRGYVRITKQEKKRQFMTHQKVGKMWTDPFYYGLFIHGDATIDLVENDPGFQPMITFTQHEILCDRKKDSQRGKRKINDVDDLADIRVLENGFIVDTKGFGFSVTLPNKKKRFFPKLKELQTTNSKATLAEVVSPKQIRLYNNKTQKGISFSVFDKIIREKLSELHITQDQYLAYLTYAKEQLRNAFVENEQARRESQLRINQITRKKEDYIERNLGRDRTGEEQTIYERKLESFNADLKFYENEIKNCESKKEVEVLSVETMVKFMKNAQLFYDKATYVQKAQIIKVLFLNITYHHQKWLELKVKPELEELFCRNGRPGES